MAGESGTSQDEAAVAAFAARVFDQARAGETAALEALLAAGLPANLANGSGDTLLMLASYHGHAGTAAMLLRCGADPERANDRGQTPLAGAAFKGDLAVAEALLDGGADPEAADPAGTTPLMFAAMFDRAAVLDLLLARGADPARRNARGLAARDLAETMGARETPDKLRALPAERESEPAPI